MENRKLDKAEFIQRVSAELAERERERLRKKKQAQFDAAANAMRRHEQYLRDMKRRGRKA